MGKKTVPEEYRPKYHTKSKVFLNTERPRLLGNIIIFLLGFREMLSKRTQRFWGCNCGKILYKLNNF